MNLRNTKKYEILLFPASTVLVSFAALGAAQAVSQVEVRLSLQALFIMLGVKDIFFGISLANYFSFEKPAEPQLPQETKPAILVGGLPIRKITPITPGHAFNSMTDHVAVNIQKKDPRVKQWASAVIYDRAPMTQARWAGGKKPFSKPEYAAWMKQLLERGVVVPKYAKGNNGGFKPNRAQGLEYLKALADGREYLPLPQVDRSENDYLWVRA